MVSPMTRKIGSHLNSESLDLLASPLTHPRPSGFAIYVARLPSAPFAARHLTFGLAEKSATGKVERRWLSLFVAAMGALPIFALARRLLRYALDFMRLTQPPLQGA
jgi:hypothetical protein